MTGDHLSYRRATTVSLVGLTLQLLLAALLLAYALVVGDSAALTGALAIGLGATIWIALAVMFHQHKLERLEAMELEAYLGSSAAQSTVFGEAHADEQPHGRRLAALHRFFLPTVSLVLGIAYAALGILRFLEARSALDVEAGFVAPHEPGWAIAIGVLLVIVGFVFARFVAGMAKQKTWMLLHGGSGAAVGSALIGVALAVSSFVKVAAHSDVALQYLGVILAGYMIVLGVEMALNFVLNLYRPRQVGEYQRPAFDSRVLAFVAAPDRLAESIGEAVNYQFGFDVSSTWAYRLVARQAPMYVVLSLLVVWGLSVFTVVGPAERGLLVVNGKMVREIGPGLVVSWPWPWTRIDRFPAEAVNEIQIGSSKPIGDNPILWTNEHSDEERFFLVQPAAQAQRSSLSGQATGGLDLVAAEIPITYIVSDLRKYKQLAQDSRSGDVDEIRHKLLKAVASKVVMQQMATLSVDEVLGPGRAQLGGELRTMIQAEFDRSLDAGVDVLFVGVLGAHPQRDVSKAFEEVVASDQTRQTTIEKAEADAIRSLASVVGDVERAKQIASELDQLDKMADEGAPAKVLAEHEQQVMDLIMDAGGEAAVLISEARAARWRQHMRAASRAASVEGLERSYRAAPGPFRVARYISALREAAKDARVYISPFENMTVRLNKEEQSPIVSGFDLGPGAETNQ